MPGKGLSIALRALALFALILFVTSSWAANNWHMKVLHHFGAGTDGQNPWSSLVRDAAGNLYGPTSLGGRYSRGTVFELSPNQGGSWTETVVHEFTNDPTNGWYPNAALLLDAAGNLYGPTTYGEQNPGGIIFELSPIIGGGWTETVLHQFGIPYGDASNPHSDLISDAAGNLYGTTDYGGTDDRGTVFELSPTQSGGWTEAVLYSFPYSGVDGEYPLAGLIFDSAGNLYGTTTGGGTNNPGGTVFKLTPGEDGSWTETVLYRFGILPDGEEPWAGLVFDPVGNLYGTTRRGGAYEVGTLFELSPNGDGSWSESVLHSFGNGTDGYQPLYGRLIFDAAGNLYGTTQEGGNTGGGTVFEFSPNGSGGWTETVLHSFDTVADGYWPYSGVIFDPAGNLYGTTDLGGAYDDGTAFELTPIHPCTKCNRAVIQ